MGKNQHIVPHNGEWAVFEGVPTHAVQPPHPDREAPSAPG